MSKKLLQSLAKTTTYNNETQEEGDIAYAFITKNNSIYVIPMNGPPKDIVSELGLLLGNPLAEKRNFTCSSTPQSVYQSGDESTTNL